jgi:hypothetical protein
MDILVILILVLSIITIIKVLASPHQDKSQQLVRIFCFPRSLFGADPRRSGSWWAGDWFIGERVNNAITSGKKRYARKKGKNYN